MNIHPKFFILKDFIDVGPSATINVGRMVATQPFVSQPDGEPLSSMIDLVGIELTILITPFPKQ